MTTGPIPANSVAGLRIRLQLARDGLLRLRKMARTGAEYDHLAARIQRHHRSIERLRNALTNARVHAMRGWTATLSGTPGATLSELAAEEQLMLRLGAKQAAERRAAQQAVSTVSKGRWLGVTTPVAITLAAVLAIVAVGIYANSRQQSVLEQSRQSSTVGDPVDPFIGPDPILDDCAPNVATQHGLLWTGEAGWRAPDADPQPLLYEYLDRFGETPEVYDRYLLDVADWEGRILGRVAEMFVDVEEECGAGVQGPIPEDDVLCSFFPGDMVGGIDRSAAINDGSAMRSACIFRDGAGGEGLRIWAELYGVDSDELLPSDALVYVLFEYSGPSTELGIGDRTVVIEQSDRHILVGSSGSMLFVFYACSDCEGTLVARLEPLAEHVVDEYEVWAAGQGN